jgi:hypothetical protein
MKILSVGGGEPIGTRRAHKHNSMKLYYFSGACALAVLLRFIERMQADASVRTALFTEESDVIQYREPAGSVQSHTLMNMAGRNRELTKRAEY